MLVLYTGKSDKIENLSLNISVMKILSVWPETTRSSKYLNKHTFMLLSFLWTVYTLIHGLIIIVNDPLRDFIGILDIITALVAIISMEYMSQCLINNIDSVKKLVYVIKHFFIYGAEEVITETEFKIRKYTKSKYFCE